MLVTNNAKRIELKLPMHETELKEEDNDELLSSLLVESFRTALSRVSLAVSNSHVKSIWLSMSAESLLHMLDCLAQSAIIGPTMKRLCKVYIMSTTRNYLLTGAEKGASNDHARLQVKRNRASESYNQIQKTNKV